MKKIINIRRIGTFLLAGLLTSQLLVPVMAEETDASPAAETGALTEGTGAPAEETEVSEAEAVMYIRSAEELVTLAEYCRLDSWSRGKTVILQKDISLSGVEFTTIPTFGGTFDGGGHTISGWTLTDGCAPGGLFSLLQAGSEIRDLHVEGTVEPEGNADVIGGIAGENSGTITRCSFAGSLTGDTVTGGITGRNTITGTVSKCQVEGGIFGDTMIGGIAGENNGTISGCTNAAYINTEAKDPVIEVSDLDVNSLDITNMDLADKVDLLNSGSLYNIASDIGGVAGFSDGMLLDCINSGSVGYQHVGYNVGGIAGRSRGFVSGCENQGEICGRKEVGGIVGQAEPYVASTLSGTTVSSIRTELEKLSQMVDRAARDAQNSSNSISNRLTGLTQDVSGATDHVKALGDALTDYGDETIDEINRGGDIVEHAADQMSAAVDQLPDIGEKIEKALDRIDAVMGRLEKSEAAGSASMEELKLSAEDLKEASHLQKTAVEQIRTGISAIRGAVTRDGLKIHVDWAQVKNGIAQVREGVKLPINGDPAGRQQGTAALVRSAMGHMQEGMNGLSALAGQTEEGVADIRDAMDILQSTANDVTAVLDDLTDITDYLDGVDPITFGDVSSRTSKASSQLYNTMQDMSNKLELLNQETRNASDRLTADIRGINDQFMVVMNLMLDEIDAAEDLTTDSRVLDTSDEDLDAVTYGKLFRCTNSGAVYGDFNVGGAAGSMGIYNKLDPEGDGFSTLSDSARKRYELKAVLQNCVNTGSITAKRNYVGSICGFAKLGVISDCEAYGSVESEDGDYVGGLAGGCCTIIRSSYAKCSLSGEKYIGGIVGAVPEEGSDTALISECTALIEIPDAMQYAGSIAGRDEGTFRGNHFVADTLAGIDRMSYADRAEPVSYETLLEQEGLPSAFRKFTLTFKTEDDETVAAKEFSYGESFDDSVFPEIPEKDGMYGRWDREELKNLKFDTVITAEYFPSVTAIASDAKREDGRVAFLVEGEFSDRDTLTAVPAILDFHAAPNGIWQTLLSYNRELLEQWQLTTPENNSEGYTVRYLAPNGQTDHLHVYLLENETWQEVPCSSVGTYLTFQVLAGETVVTVLKASTTWWIWLVLGIFLAVMLIVVIRHHLLTRLYKRAAARVAEREAAAAALPAIRRKLRHLLIILAGLIVLMVITVGAIVHFVPGAKADVELYRMLNSYELHDDLDMELSMDVTVGGKNYTSTMPLYITTTEGKRVSCVELRGIPLYFTNGHMLLENGAAYTADGLFPDGETLLHRSAALFRTLKITSSGEEGDKTYKVRAEAAAADELLAMFLSGRAAGSAGMDVELVTKSGRPSLLHFVWEGSTVNGTPAAMDAELNLDVPQQEEHQLPLEVSTAASGSFENAVDLTEEIKELLLAVTDLAQQDPMEADLSLTANSGPLLMNDTIRLQYTVEAGKDLICLTNGGLTLYLADDSICASDGTAAVSSLSGASGLLPVLYQAVLKGGADRTEKDGRSVYTLDMDDESMEALVTAMTSDAKVLNLVFRSGRLKAEIADGRLETLSAQCSGTAKIALADVPASFTVKAKFSGGQETFSAPDSVVKALGLKKE